MAATVLTVFVYGTLRRGGRFHDDYCRGARSIDDARVRGRLTTMPAGYPVLDVPPRDVLRAGTADLLSDARALGELSLEPAGFLPGWTEIAGELMVFEDAAERLARLDELEGFEPGRRSLYRRVALPVTRADGSRTPAWTYTRGDYEI